MKEWLTEIANHFSALPPPPFSCHFSPPFSQNNRDNNYLNLNYEYKGKWGETCSCASVIIPPVLKMLSLLNSHTAERWKDVQKASFLFHGNYSHKSVSQKKNSVPISTRLPKMLGHCKCSLEITNEEGGDMIWWFYLRVYTWNEE